MTLDRQNFLVGIVALVVVVLGMVWAGVTANGRADDLRAEKERTEQVRIQACTTVEDDEVRSLCIAAEEKR